MSNIDKIRQEIERRKKICEDIFERESDTYYQGKAVAYGELLPFIDSLPDEHLRDSTKMISEDERIAEELIKALRGISTGLHQYAIFLTEEEKQRWLSWLEKQKENANSFTDGVIEVRSFQRGLKEGRRLERQKEQKHPNGCFTCDEYKKGYEEGRRNGFTAGYNKAMKEVEQKEQKPVVTLGETYHVDTLGTQQVIAGKMPQKPAEWSEEDEIYLQDALWCVEKAEKSCKDEEDKGACWSAKRWLKSLRPVSKESLQSHWKPSENQMSMLLAVVNDPNNAGSASCHLSLKSLYNELKKL